MTGQERTDVHYIVKDEHTLGYVFDAQPGLMGVLSSKKDGHHPNGSPVSISFSEIRPATAEDFETFRVKLPPDFHDRKEEKGIPEFAPRIFEEGGIGLVYQDGRMFGAIDVGQDSNGKKTLTISEWSSHSPGKGHSRQALEWLRSQGFETITANSVGLIENGVGDISTIYWEHMHALGLVDVLLDDNGQDITPRRMQGESLGM